MRYAQANAAKMTVLPMAGIVVYNTIWLGGRMGTVQQETGSRRVVPSGGGSFRMEVQSSGSSGPAESPPGAESGNAPRCYPGLALPVALDELSPLGHTGQFTEMSRSFHGALLRSRNRPEKLPTFQGGTGPRARFGKQRAGRSLPEHRVCIGHSFVWLKNGGTFEKRTVTVGRRNDLNAVVESGLAEGDVIRLDASEEVGAAD